MSSEVRGDPTALRLWWTVPLGLVVVTAIVFVAVVLPALASGPRVPSQLDVHRSPSPARPSSAATGSPHPTRSTTVVPPEQPVVRESDDRHNDKGGHGSEESNDR